MSQKDGIVHLRDLPEDKVFVKFPDNVQKEMVEKALEFLKTEDKLAKKLDSNQGTVNDFKNSRLKSTNLKFIKNLSLFLCESGMKEFSLENLEKQIELIKTQVGFGIQNPKFPMNFNSVEGSQIISAFLFDGGIRKSLIPFYVNGEGYLIKRLISNLEKIVGKIHYVRYSQHKVEETYFIDFSRILGVILNSGLNIPAGKKVFTNPSVPQFIMNGNKEIQKVFLQQAFDDDGTVKGKGKTKGKRIKLSQNHSKNKPPIRLLQLKKLLENFGIRVTGPFYEAMLDNKRGYRSYRWAIEISNQLDIRNFAEKINFSLERKRKDVEDLLNSYTSEPLFKKGTVVNEVLKVCKELKSQNQKITNKNIAEKLKRTESYVRRLTLRMLREGRLKIVKERVNLGGRKGATRREFDLTKKVKDV